MKKVIVAYASAGAGHFKAAEAICDFLKDQRPDLEPALIDILDKTNPLFKLTYVRGYHLMINHMVLIWKWLFWVTSVWSLRPITRRAVTLANSLNVIKFEHFLIKEQPDYIVSTHFLTSELVAHLKKKGKISSKVITVITDFGVHPFWISHGVDLYVVASDYTSEKLSDAGVEKERIKVFGIPVSRKFLQAFDRAALFKKLGLDPDKFTVLIITGSFGIGPIEEITVLLSGVCQTIVVCARNTDLFRRLKEKKYSDCLIVGFADNIEELMAASDVIITKPGGMSTSESLIMGLVPIFISPIPGQEMENIRALESFGIGFYPKDISVIKELIIDLKDYPEKLKAMRESINLIRKPDALSNISNVIR